MIIGLEKSLDDWYGKNTGKLWSLLALLAGIITSIVGYGSWRSPGLDWISFRKTFQLFVITIFDEMSRMIENPFAIVGFVVLIVGLILTKNSAKRVLSYWFG